MEQRRPSQKAKKAWASSPRQAKQKARQGKPKPESLLPVIQARLNVLFPDAEEQIAWMEKLHPLFAMPPMEMITSGRDAMLLAQLEAWIRDEK